MQGGKEVTTGELYVGVKKERSSIYVDNTLLTLQYRYNMMYIALKSNIQKLWRNTSSKNLLDAMCV